MEEGASRQVNGAGRGRAVGAGRGGRGKPHLLPRAPGAPAASPALPLVLFQPLPRLPPLSQGITEHWGKSFLGPGNVSKSPPSDSESVARPAHNHVCILGATRVGPKVP